MQDEPSMLLMDLGGWTVDLMRIDNAIHVADTAHSLELGMIRCAGNIVPFTNSFPKDTKLYKLMSINPSEKKE